MTVVDSISAWLPVSPHEAAAAATDSSASTCAAESAPESAFPSSSSPSAHCLLPNASSCPFPDCDPLSDTILAKIAAGTECLAAIASFHHIPYPRFTLWLLQPSTQERLAALSVAIASAARLTATAALPDIVRGLKTTVDQLQSPTHMTIAPSELGPEALRAQSLILRRHRAIIAAASLIYRISRFTVPSVRPTSPKGEVPPKAAEGARSPAGGADGGAVERSETEGAPAFSLASSTASSSSLPTSDIVGGPLPASHIAPMPVDEAIQTIIEDFDLTNQQAAELRKDPETWIRANLLKQHNLVELKPRRKRRARRSADDG